MKSCNVSYEQPLNAPRTAQPAVYRRRKCCLRGNVVFLFVFCCFLVHVGVSRVKSESSDAVTEVVGEEDRTMNPNCGSFNQGFGLI